MVPAAASYVDFGSLAGLKASAARDEPGALEEAAVQFEALVIGMMLKSARKASLGEGLFDNAGTEQYLELMDQQVSLELARHGGFGFGRMIGEQLGSDGVAAAESPQPVARRSRAREIGSPREFVERFLPDAERAGRALGVDARLLLAQAALETGWGQSMPRHADGRSANNLFGLKAGQSWSGERVSRWTLEYANGIPERRREHFRSYQSTAESFADYVALVRDSGRYDAALGGADAGPERYVHGLADAGYATDPDYADKWLSIFHGDTLSEALSEAASAPAEAQVTARTADIVDADFSQAMKAPSW